MRLELDQLPVNGALLSLVNHNERSNGSTSQRNDGMDEHPLPQHPPPAVPPNHAIHYFTAIKSIKELALLLKPYAGNSKIMNCIKKCSRRIWLFCLNLVVANKQFGLILN